MAGLEFTMAGGVNLAIPLGAPATVFLADTLGIILAAQACGRRVGHGRTVIIYSDN